VEESTIDCQRIAASARPDQGNLNNFFFVEGSIRMAWLTVFVRDDYAC
jgi:hypothetical protein